MSHTTNLNALGLTPAVQLSSQSTGREKYELPVAISHVWDINVLIAQGP